VNETQNHWRTELFSTDLWLEDQTNAMQAGEAGGYRVKCDGYEFGAYLKPKNKCAENHPRAANEKIVADIAAEVGLSIPPVLLYRRENAPAGEENLCCVSLVQFPEQYEWGLLWNYQRFDKVVQDLLFQALNRYSGEYALDFLIGQTDRHNERNVVYGADKKNPGRNQFMFLDHSNSLNMGDRWAGDKWRNVETPAVPEVFKKSMTQKQVLKTGDDLAGLADGKIEEIVSRIPDDYMKADHKAVVISGLKGRRALIKTQIEKAL
jgi:hypothetical protein